MKPKKEAPRCATCRHAFTTWEPAHPYGCRAYGFRSHRPPFEVVKQTSGRDCQLFEPRPAPRRKPGARTG